MTKHNVNISVNNGRFLEFVETTQSILLLNDLYIPWGKGSPDRDIEQHQDQQPYVRLEPSCKTVLQNILRLHRKQKRC